MIPPLTSSEMGSWAKCRRGWWVSYYRHLRPIGPTPSALWVGSLYHNGLDRWYTQGEEDPAGYVRKQTDEAVERWPEVASRLMKDGELAAIMIEGYIEHCQETGWDSEFRIIGAEQSVELPLGNTGFRLRGKIDARLERIADSAWLQLEHKTVQNLAEIPKYADEAPQFLTYDLLSYLMALEEGEGRRTDGVLINMARKVKRTASAHPPFYGRHTVIHNEEQLRSHFRNIVAIGNEIASARARLDAGEDFRDVCYPNVDRNHLWGCGCSALGPMLSDGSDYEGYFDEFYEEYDPWERYQEEGGE